MKIVVLTLFAVLLTTSAFAIRKGTNLTDKDWPWVGMLIPKDSISDTTPNDMGTGFLLACPNDAGAKVLVTAKHVLDKGTTVPFFFNAYPDDTYKRKQAGEKVTFYVAYLKEGSMRTPSEADLALARFNLRENIGEKSRARLKDITAPEIFGENDPVPNSESKLTLTGYGAFKSEQGKDQGQLRRRQAKDMPYWGRPPGMPGSFGFSYNSEKQIGCAGDSGSPGQIGQKVYGVMTHIANYPAGGELLCSKLNLNAFLPLAPHRTFIEESTTALCKQYADDVDKKVMINGYEAPQTLAHLDANFDASWEATNVRSCKVTFTNRQNGASRIIWQRRVAPESDTLSGSLHDIQLPPPQGGVSTHRFFDLTLECVAIGGEIVSESKLITQENYPIPSVTLLGAPMEDQFSVSWTATANSCDIYQDGSLVGSNLGASSSIMITPTRITTQMEARCRNSVRTGIGRLTLTIPPVVIARFEATPMPPMGYLLSWNVSNATHCEMLQNGSPLPNVLSGNDSLSVIPASRTTYRLRCSTGPQTALSSPLVIAP